MMQRLRLGHPERAHGRPLQQSCAKTSNLKRSDRAAPQRFALETTFVPDPARYAPGRCHGEQVVSKAHPPRRAGFWRDRRIPSELVVAAAEVPAVRPPLRRMPAE